MRVRVSHWTKIFYAYKFLNRRPQAKTAFSEHRWSPWVSLARFAFQLPVKLITDSSLKNFYICLQWRHVVLLERDSNLATSCSVIEKKLLVWKVKFCKFSLFSSYFFCQLLGKSYIDTNNQSRICGKGVGSGLFSSDSLESKSSELIEIAHIWPYYSVEWLYKISFESYGQFLRKSKKVEKWLFFDHFLG